MDESGYFIASIVLQSATLFMLTGTLIFFGLQWARGRRAAGLSMRPYLGFDDITYKDTDVDDKIEFDAWVYNYGNIPAVNATMHGEFSIDNGEHTEFTCETKGAVFPYAKTRERWLLGAKDMGKKDKIAILSGEKTLYLALDIEYFSSTGKKYFTKTSRTFNHLDKSWINVECELS